MDVGRDKLITEGIVQIFSVKLSKLNNNEKVFRDLNRKCTGEAEMIRASRQRLCSCVNAEGL